MFIYTYGKHLELWVRNIHLDTFGSVRLNNNAISDVDSSPAQFVFATFNVHLFMY